jgi:hypothetical protein
LSFFVIHFLAWILPGVSKMELKDFLDLMLKGFTAFFAYKAYRLAETRWGAEAVKLRTERLDRYRKDIVEKMNLSRDDLVLWTLRHHLEYGESLKELFELMHDVGRKLGPPRSRLAHEFFAMVRKDVEMQLSYGNTFDEILKRRREVRLAELKKTKANLRAKAPVPSHGD